MTDGERPDLIVPQGIGVPTKVDKRTQLELHDRSTMVCGGAATIRWGRSAGPKRNLPVTLYCWQPGCMTTGECTGARFVPHMEQFTDTDPDSPTRMRRTGRPKSKGGTIPDDILFTDDEVVASVRMAARLRQPLGARLDERSDREIAADVADNWKKTRGSMGGQGWG